MSAGSRVGGMGYEMADEKAGKMVVLKVGRMVL